MAELVEIATAQGFHGDSAPGAGPPAPEDVTRVLATLAARDGEAS